MGRGKNGFGRTDGRTDRLHFSGSFPQNREEWHVIQDRSSSKNMTCADNGVTKVLCIIAPIECYIADIDTCIFNRKKSIRMIDALSFYLKTPF